MNKTETVELAATALVGLALIAVSLHLIKKQDAAVHQTVGDAVESMHIHPNKDNSYLITPSGATKVYKFYDDVGAICFLAETASQSASIYCIPGAK